MRVADIVIENFRPGVLKKYRLDAESALELRPQLIYCSISGFGNTGTSGSGFLNTAKGANPQAISGFSNFASGGSVVNGGMSGFLNTAVPHTIPFAGQPAGYYSGFGAVTAELYPTSIRATAQGFTYNLGRIASAAAPFTVASLAANQGFSVAFTVTGVAFLMAAVMWIWIPETQGRELA